MPPGTAACGDGRISAGNKISSAKTAAWPVIDKERGSLILSTTNAPPAIARSIRDYRNPRNFAAATSSLDTRRCVRQFFDLT
jgi:hypothetical protein